MSYRIYIGPKTNAPSFSWVLTDIFKFLEKQYPNYAISYFDNEEEIDSSCDMVIFSKHIPTSSTFIRLKKCKIVFIPIDCFYSTFHIWSELPALTLFDGILIHNTNIKEFLPSRVCTYQIDHYRKYVIERKAELDNKMLWLGVSEYVPLTIDFLIREKIHPKEILLLADTQNIIKDMRSFNKNLESFNLPECVIEKNEAISINGYLVQQWTPERQNSYLAICKACIDVKTNDFRHYTKPPTKCQLHASSGIPQFVNIEHPAIGLLEFDGIRLKTIDEMKKMNVYELESYGNDLLKQCNGRYELENVAKTYFQAISCIVESTSNKRSFMVLKLVFRELRHILFSNLSSGSHIREFIRRTVGK
ncbi:hypothetical protein KUL152_25450 [Tenacibaculum sp. KUL152]|nr:hypothetical protein KUL152_25450 [Tenacibaculum sp. KUL152]